MFNFKTIGQLFIRLRFFRFFILLFAGFIFLPFISSTQRTIVDSMCEAYVFHTTAYPKNQKEKKRKDSNTYV